MNWWLLIHEELELGTLIGTILQPVLPIKLVRARNLQEAQRAILTHGYGNCKLIVSSPSAPLDADQSRPLDRTRPTITSFLQQVRLHDVKPPFIVVLSVNESTRSEELSNIPNTQILAVGEMLQLPAMADRLMSGAAEKRKKLQHDVDVDISLSDGGGRWAIHGSKTNPIEDSGQFQIGWRELDRLFVDSRRAGGAPHDAIGQLGNDMYEHLLVHPGLELKLARCTRPPGSLESVRFRFHVDQETSQLLVETLAKPRHHGRRSELDFWMLRTPIFRKFGGQGVRHPLFKDRRSRGEKVECLIIQGDADAFNAGGQLAQDFPAIPGAAYETNWLEKYLVKNQDGFNLAPPRVLRPSFKEGEDYGATVRAALSERCWRLIHYVGHSAIGKDGRGYLALGSGLHDLIDINDFAERAKDAQFVFLNSCQSADPKFIMKLVEKNIPAVAGYAWNIDDNVAHEFARHFYEDLFAGTVSNRFLEYAFMRAKVHLHETYKDRTVWTAPLLFMQMLKAEDAVEEGTQEVTA
jgi:hypothetical protein